jgi:hypothetical protein
MVFKDHWFKKFINHQWVIAIGASLVPGFLNWIVSLDFPGYVGDFFKKIGAFLNYTLAIPLWFVLTVAILAVTTTVIILFQNRTPGKYLCECKRDCTYQGKYIRKGEQIVMTEKNLPYFQLLKKMDKE